MVAAQLAALDWIAEVLMEGDVDRVLWLDAETLVFRPVALELPDSPYAVGRAVAVSGPAPCWIGHRRLHTGALMLDWDNPLLDFYHHAADRLIERTPQPWPDDLIGGRLLTALEAAVPVPVLERAGVLPPPVAADLVAGGGPALDAFRTATVMWPASLRLTPNGDDQAMDRLVERLSTDRFGRGRALQDLSVNP